MHLIEPCCTQKHLRELRNTIANGGTTDFEGYGDLSLSELLGPLLMRYNGTRLMLVAPTLPDQAAEVIGKWMRKQWARVDGRGMIDIISHLTIIADLSEEKSPIASLWLKENPFGERLMLYNLKQEETVILLPDFAITGPVNMRYGHHFVATATTEPEKVRDLWEKHMKMTEKPAKKKSSKRKKKKSGSGSDD